MKTINFNAGRSASESSNYPTITYQLIHGMVATLRYCGILLFFLSGSGAHPLPAQRQLVDSLHLLLLEDLPEEQAVMHRARLSQAYWTVHLDSSFLHGRRAKEQAEALDHPAALAKAQNSLGGAFFLRGAFREAILEFEAAHGLRRDLGDHDGAAACLNNLGNVFLEQGNLSRALDYFLRSLQLEERHGTARGRAIALLNIATVHFKQQDWERSRRYTNQALSEFEKLPGEEWYRSYAYNNLGNIAYEADRDYHRALDYHRQALELRRIAGSPGEMCGSLINIGAVYLAMEAPDQALAYLDQAQDTALTHGNRTALPDILINRGKAYEQKGAPARAIQLYRQAFGEARRTGAAPKIYDAADRLSDALHEAGNYREAYDYEVIASAYRDSLLNEEKVRELTQLEMEYAFDKERSVQEQNAQRALNRQKYIRNTALLFFAFSLLALWLLYRDRRRVRSSNTLLNQKNREIEQQKEALNVLNDTKDKLFSVIAHDLRAPLAGLKSVMIFADSDDITPEEIKSLLPQMNKSLDDASGLLENLLFWARTQMDGEHLEKEEIDLKVLIDDTVNLLAPQARNKNITLESNVASRLIASADENMIYLILRNLISNALKFTQSGGTVTVSAEPCGHHICLSIRDTGIGISPEDQAKLFSNEFFSTAGTNREKGTGLGLMLSRDFVHLHGGTLTVDSTPGEGSIFKFTIPV